MKLALSLFAAASLLRADFDPQHWQTRTPVVVKQPAPVSAIVIDPAVYRVSRARLRDLRIVRAGAEVPYRVEVLSARHEQIEFQPAILNKTAVPNAGVQAVLDLNGHPAHNRLRITTTQHNFKEAVRIETSDDARNWAVARDDGVIFDITTAGRKTSALTVDYPVSTRRYVRVTIPGWRDPADLASAWLTYFKEAAAVRDTVSTLTPSATEDPKTQTTSLVADVGFQGLAYDRLNLALEQGAFSRSVEISTSSDSKAWSLAGQGVVSQEQLWIEFPEQWNRYVKVTIFNRDNAPLKVTRLSLSALRRLLRFPSAATGSYWLYSGYPDAKQPSYDFASLAPAPAVSLGAPEPNPQYRAPTRPWTDRNPHLLNFVLVAAVAIMGFITIRFLRKVRG
jgi:Protein of unknown function (DUF3999)